ncbi:MAG: HEPN domain-containing protein [Bacilli bacterium]|nr:HEPN domain-containing protein [Bacilli bacterium]
MEKYKVKIKLLVRGFPPVIGDYEIDGFVLKNGIINESELEKSLANEEFDARVYIACVSYQIANDKKLYYNYFESKEYLIIDVPVNEASKNIKSQLSEFVLNDKLIMDSIIFLEKKLRLIYNLPIKFPIQKIFIHSEEETKITESMRLTPMPSNNGLINFDKDDFYQKSRFHLSLDSMKKIENQNINFKRALDFFNNSFNIEDVSVRFVLLFTSLEAIFNLKNINNSKIFKFNDDETEEAKITTVISVLSSKFLFMDSQDDIKEKENRFRYLYKKRGSYIHGNKNANITSEEEKELRGYVRDILILYFLCCDSMIMGKNENIARKVLVDIYVDKKLSIMIQGFADALRSKSYKESYEKNIKRVLEGIKSGRLEIIEMKDGYVTKVNEKN